MAYHTIVCISDSDKHFASCIVEYSKRLGRDCQIISLKPSRHDHQVKVIQEETDLIIKTLSRYRDAYRIACSREGKILDTMDLVTITQQHHHCVWVIGGPYGYDEGRISQVVNIKIAWGAITLQHTMVKLILLEQLYRVQMIGQGRSYHY